MNRFARSCIRAVILLAALSAAASVRAQDITPPGVSVAQIVAHPLERGRLLALTSAGSTLSSDGGRTWSTPNPSGPKDAERIFVHPGAPGVVFVQTAHVVEIVGARIPVHLGGELVRSLDFGATWTLLRPGYAVDRQPAVSPFAALPGNPAHIFATVRSNGGCVSLGCFQVYRAIDTTVLESRDNGVSWTPADAGLPAPQGLFGNNGGAPAVILGAAGPTPAARDHLALVRPDGVYVSADAARSWRRIANPALDAFEWVKLDPLRDHIVYSLRGGQILRTDDGGNHWKVILEVTRDKLPSLVPELLVEAGDGDRVWVASEGGLWLSEDGGKTWKNLGFAASSRRFGVTLQFFGGIEAMAISAASPRTAYVVSQGRLHEVTTTGDGTVPVVEFLDVANGRYWLTANPGEALAVDYTHDLAVARRTGAGFRVWSRMYFDGMAPVCRFQGNPARGFHSRFITLEGPECAALERGGDWVLEGRGEFAAFLPTGPNECRGEQVPLRRFFNGRADANHRYVVDNGLAAEMRGRGWIEEGTAMCVAAP